jgi:hypothetical protein
MVYVPVTEQKLGLYTKQDFKPETAENLKDMVLSVVEMETLIQ